MRKAVTKGGGKTDNHRKSDWKSRKWQAKKWRRKKEKKNEEKKIIPAFDIG